MIDTVGYVELLGQEYLRSYIAGGGTAVRFVVATDPAEAERLVEGLDAAAAETGYQIASVDAATTRIHLMDQLFHQVARQIDWGALALSAVHTAYSQCGYPIEPGESVSIEEVARRFDVDAPELSRDVNRRLQIQVGRDFAMAREFRVAMVRLCQAQLESGQVSDAEHSAVLDWLCGDLRQVSTLRSAMIFRRIDRHSARAALFSLAHWLAVNGRTGLVLELDIRRLAVARRPPVEDRQGLYYTKMALLDAYELLRQLVDNTDELTHCLVLVIAAPEFLSDQSRGVAAYQALKLRIYDEVRDRARDNPYASLVRLGAS